jgi:SAM-dependent methyltransferase
MSNFVNSLKHIVPHSFMPALKKTIFSLRSIYFSGSDVTCPFCHGTFRQMLPFGQHFEVLKEKEVIGGGYRDNCLCPKCNSSDRERLVYLYLKHKTTLLNSRISVLHMAPEYNLGGIFQDGNFEYISGDLDSPLAMMKMDLTELPLKNDTYDLVICNHVLEHIPQDRKAMCEIFRVMKPGGTAILQVPVSRSTSETVENIYVETEEEKTANFGQRDHVRIYAAADYVARLISTGFSVEEFDWNLHREFDPGRNKYSLNPAERIFIATK